MTYKYVVCTPAGMQRVLDSERLPSLFVGDPVIVVPRWDLPLILNAAVQKIIEGYRDVQTADEAEDQELSES